MKPPIYQPAGKAREYADWAINLSLSCPHSCFYCYCPQMLYKTKEVFFNYRGYRPGIYQEILRQINRENITGRLIQLGFIGDPYPKGYDSTPTREIIKLLKQYGNNVQILTKNGEDAMRDFDLLDENDWFGVSITGASAKQEPGASPEIERLLSLIPAGLMGIKIWVSFEPVINADAVLGVLIRYGEIFDKVKVGKLNYHLSDIDWADFGRKFERICQDKGIDCYIKDSLREEMNK